MIDQETNHLPPSSMRRCWGAVMRPGAGLTAPTVIRFPMVRQNNWIDRTHAAVAFVGYVAKLRKDGWRCHIVAHSHGGNVLVEALPQIATPSPSQPTGTIVTLGSPLMDTMSPIFRRIRRASRILDVTSWTVFPMVTAGLAVIAYVSGGIVRDLAAVSVLLIMLPLDQWIVRMRRTTAQAQPPLLFAMGSPVDQAWQILYHRRLCKIHWLSNQIYSVTCSLHCDLTFREQQVARIHGVKSYRDLGIIAKLMMAITYVVTLLTILLIVVSVLDPGENAKLDGFISFLVICSIVILVFVLFLRADPRSSGFRSKELGWSIVGA